MGVGSLHAGDSSVFLEGGGGRGRGFSYPLL